MQQQLHRRDMHTIVTWFQIRANSIFTSFQSWAHKLCEIDDLVQDCSNSIANAMELLQPCTKPSKWSPAFYVTCNSSADSDVFPHSPTATPTHPTPLHSTHQLLNPSLSPPSPDHCWFLNRTQRTRLCRHTYTRILYPPSSWCLGA